MAPGTSADRNAKRELLVDAAARVLLEEGVAGCTARAVADAAGVSKSAIHYYFEEIDQIVELAWVRLMTQFVDAMELVAASAEDPYRSVWDAAEVYLRRDTEKGQQIPIMAFDFLVAASRKGDTAAVQVVVRRIQALFRRLVTATGVSDPAARADALVSALMGSVVRSMFETRRPATVLAGLSKVLGIPLRGPAVR